MSTAEITTTTPFETVLREVQPMIISIVKETKNVYGLDNEDLEQELRIQVWDSWKEWDPNRGTKFSSYVYPALQNRKNMMVRACKALRRNGGYTPLSLDEERDHTANGKSLDGCCLGDIIAGNSQDPESLIYMKEIQEVVENVISTYSQNIQSIIRCMLSGMTQVETCEKTRVCQSLVSYHMKAFRLRLKKELRNKGFELPMDEPERRRSAISGTNGNEGEDPARAGDRRFEILDAICDTASNKAVEKVVKSYAESRRPILRCLLSGMSIQETSEELDVTQSMVDRYLTSFCKRAVQELSRQGVEIMPFEIETQEGEADSLNHEIPSQQAENVAAS